MAGKREEQLKEITERLEQGVKDLFTSEKYTEYLKTMSQFHNYSFNNTLLIWMQKPESTLVAGYATWTKKFHRQVKRGEKGIKIIAPVPVMGKDEIEKFDLETNGPVLHPDGQREIEEVEHTVPRFRVATVFDISQTLGEPLPELDTPELMGSVENFGIFMEAIRMVSPSPMRYAEIKGSSKGYYNNASKEIVIQEEMSEKQTMKTAIHEVTHAMCHDRDMMEKLGEKKTKMTIETEAESVAFAVCSFFNLDTSDYSFPYLAGWASSMEMEELRTAMDFIRKTAGYFIDSMVENIQKLQIEKAAKRELPEFFPQREKSREQGKEAEAGRYIMKEKMYPPFYPHSLAYAIEHGRAGDYRESKKINLDCKNAIEDAVRKNFDGMHLAHDTAKGVLEEYGTERVVFILANTVQRLEHDGRISARNKAWAKGYEIPENVNHGIDMNEDYVVSSHPAILDGFIGLARDEIREQEIRKEEIMHINEKAMAEPKTKKYLNHCDVEAAYQTEKGYFSIQTVSGGYDYTIYGKDFREIDGGVYDNPDLSIREAMEAILSDEGIPVATCKPMDYEELQEKTETAAQEELRKAQAKETGKGKLPFVSDMTEPEPALNGQSRAGIEETVLCYAQAKIDEMRLSEEVELLGARVYGSRSREGLYHEGSDIDVAVSYSGGLKEDAFFNALHEDGLKIAGIPVDINPIFAEKTGTLEEYLEGAEKYLDEKQSHIEIPEKNGEPAQGAVITFYVAECTEFPGLGEYHERLETLQEAMELYEKIPAERMNGIKGIGFCLEDGSIYDGNFDLMVMGEIQTEFINEIPQYRKSPLVQKAIADMEAILSKQVERNAPDTARTETKAAEPIKSVKHVPKPDRNISSGSKKQSVLNALRERQEKMKAQEKKTPEQGNQTQKAQARKKGEPKL